jgi:hypothetical protein
MPSPEPRIDALLAELYAKENTTTKPWRQPGARTEVAPANGRGG